MKRFIACFKRTLLASLGGWIASNIGFWFGCLPMKVTEQWNERIRLADILGIGWPSAFVILAAWIIIVLPTDFFLPDTSPHRVPMQAVKFGTVITFTLVGIPIAFFSALGSPPDLTALPYIVGTIAAGAGTGLGVAFLGSVHQPVGHLKQET